MTLYLYKINTVGNCTNICSYCIVPHAVDFMKTLTLMEATLEAENEVYREITFFVV